MCNLVNDCPLIAEDDGECVNVFEGGNNAVRHNAQTIGSQNREGKFEDFRPLNDNTIVGSGVLEIPPALFIPH